jgi:GAF domain-containing protein
LQAEVAEYPESSVLAQSYGFRTALNVPLLRGGEAIGAVSLRRTEVRPFTDRQIELLQTFADQAVIAIENVRLFQELQARNRELTGALERQTATKEVLETISRSTFDLPSVLITLIERATRLCRAEHSSIFRVEGEFLHLEADNGGSPEFREFRRQHPIPLGSGSAPGRAAAEGHTVHIADVLADPDYPESEAQRLMGFRTVLTVPMLRKGRAMGVITLWRTRVEPFHDREIALVTTFADQAVIAIENVRLLKDLQARNTELTESLEQQTATSEVLKVISRSTFDLQPVLQSLIESAVRLCGADKGFIDRQHEDVYRMTVAYGESPEFIEVVKRHPARLGRESATGRVLLEHRVIHIHDAMVDPEYHWAEAERGEEVRTILAVPMLREGEVIGVFVIRRTAVRPFTEKQIELVKTFADQAVIAIENVRLFTELQEKNRALTDAHAQVTESLEQKTATADILRVIASSPTDLQPVFEDIAASALRLCGATWSGVELLDGEMLQLAAMHNIVGQTADVIRGMYPMPLSRRQARRGRSLRARWCMCRMCWRSRSTRPGTWRRRSDIGSSRSSKTAH